MKSVEKKSAMYTLNYVTLPGPGLQQRLFCVVYIVTRLKIKQGFKKYVGFSYKNAQLRFVFHPLGLAGF